jgi:hypothetical protein
MASFQVDKWLERMVAERMQEKQKRVKLLAEAHLFRWELVFIMQVAAAMGGPKNGFAFEQLVTTAPPDLFSRLRHQPLAMEAFFLGWAGALCEKNEDEHYHHLQNEFQFLISKFKLDPPALQLHFFRMRPSSFPTFRLALLAKMLTRNEMVFNESFLERGMEEWISIFNSIQLPPYWETHYIPGIPSAFHKANVSDNLKRHLLINAIIPFMMAYADNKGKQEEITKWLQWMYLLPSESNQVTGIFLAHGIRSSSAADSQALLQLKHHYCDLKNCLNCAIGKKVLEGNWEVSV